MEPKLHSKDENSFMWFFILVILVLLFCFFLLTIDIDLGHDTFHSSSYFYAAVISSLPMYLMFAVLPNFFNGIIGNFSALSYLLTRSHCVLFAGVFCFYAAVSLWAWHHLHDVDKKWQLFVPFILASGSEVLCRTLRGYAPIEVSRYFEGTPTIGEVWANACSVYYLEVFKDFSERLERFEKKHRLIDETFAVKLKKMIILIPLSCNAEGTLDKHCRNIQYIDILDIHKDAQGGNVNRQYKNPIYKITSTAGDKRRHMHIAIEEPNTLVAVKKLRETVTEEIWEFQRDEFISNLRSRLSGQTCCKFLIYNDLEEPALPLNEFLFEEVTKLLKLEES